MRVELPAITLRRRLSGHLLCAVAMATALSACRNMSPSDDLPTGADAYSATDAQIAAFKQQSYRIGEFDHINVIVFREDQLSVKDGEVDQQGNIGLPLLGSVPAAGKTVDELSADIAARLAPKYLKDPRVTVTLNTSQIQRVTVTGEVMKPGIYPFKGELTLLQALALAEDTERTVKLDEIIVFRKINGARMGAVFNLKRIRAGHDPDPQILPDDIVMAGFSNARGLWVDFLQAAPIWGFWQLLDNNN